MAYKLKTLGDTSELFTGYLKKIEVGFVELIYKLFFLLCNSKLNGSLMYVEYPQNFVNIRKFGQSL